MRSYISVQSYEVELWTVKLEHIMKRSCLDLKKCLVVETHSSQHTTLSQPPIWETLKIQTSRKIWATTYQLYLNWASQHEKDIYSNMILFFIKLFYGITWLYIIVFFLIFSALCLLYTEVVNKFCFNWITCRKQCYQVTPWKQNLSTTVLPIGLSRAQRLICLTKCTFSQVIL